MTDNWSQFELADMTWNVKSRYENLSTPQFGAFGVVCFADDKGDPNNPNDNNIITKRVAIKRVTRPFDAKRTAKLAYRELSLLKHVSHDNIIKLLDTFTTATKAEEMDSFYIVTNFMESNLKNILNFQKLSDDQIVFLTYQLLRGLKYLHSCNIVHRDLKPSNITVNEECELRIIDFGLARSENVEMSPYVVTRWYRAPDILTHEKYTKAVDIWSVGCILSEMYSSMPLFPGSDFKNQLEKILDVTGYPSEAEINTFVDGAKKFFKELRKKPRRVNFHDYFSFIKDRQAINLLENMLEFDPKKRITCEEALQHPYFKGFHDPDDEPTGEIYENELENKDLKIEEWKSKIFDEIQNFKPEIKNVQ